MAVHILPTRPALLVGSHRSDVYVGTAEELVAAGLVRPDELPGRRTDAPNLFVGQVSYDREGKVVKSGTHGKWHAGARRIERISYRSNRFRVTVCVDKHAGEDGAGNGVSQSELNEARDLLAKAQADFCDAGSMLSSIGMLGGLISSSDEETGQLVDAIGACADKGMGKWHDCNEKLDCALRALERTAAAQNPAAAGAEP